MKVLLLTLLLSLVCTDLSKTDLSQFSGQWKILYVASNNLEMTRESSPLMGFFPKINVDTANADIVFNIHIRENGECVEKFIPGTRIEGHVFLLRYAGITLAVLPYATEASLLGYFINIDENDVVSITTFMLGKSNRVNEQDFEKFKELTQKLDIPEANIVNMINSGDCPAN